MIMMMKDDDDDDDQENDDKDFGEDDDDSNAPDATFYFPPLSLSPPHGLFVRRYDHLFLSVTSVSL